jgi:hypothetical protein
VSIPSELEGVSVLCAAAALATIWNTFFPACVYLGVKGAHCHEGGRVMLFSSPDSQMSLCALNSGDCGSSKAIIPSMAVLQTLPHSFSIVEHENATRNTTRGKIARNGIDMSLLAQYFE